ncbi:hypothetical protein F4553_000609 [Allocatelliglobosispora scoriae]|uniref:Peptidase inhibitor family I36 n=1 Tax=Allocatelliglobosispora scoriae TaxID=643052 RepID=A0A841BK90_9ACTN|nr:peptidase inhibitor family I36 protein [Allocatelliglobosispora scoriae]MBB5867230.1 hypothetical protein [Allocatelliglobosispora scoriae]
MLLTSAPRSRLAALIATAAATAFLILPTPAHASSSCAAENICLWTGANYTGTKTSYDYSSFFGSTFCISTPFRSLKIGGGPHATLVATSAYQGTACSVLGGLQREDDLSLFGDPVDNPSFTFGPALSLSGLVVT